MGFTKKARNKQAKLLKKLEKAQAYGDSMLFERNDALQDRDSWKRAAEQGTADIKQKQILIDAQKQTIENLQKALEVEKERFQRASQERERLSNALGHSGRALTAASGK